jgi:fucose 4-O-acetylase-like acetyltransferase
MRRDEFLDFVKGVLITLVVIGHATQYAVYQNAEFWSDPLFKAIYMFHMPLFMAVAGYVSFRGITTAASQTAYVTRRVLVYGVPIFVWATIAQSVTLIFGDQGAWRHFPFAVIHYGVSSLWFLWALLGSITVTALVESTGRFRPTGYVFALCAVLALPEMSHLPLFKYTFPFFLAGFFAARAGPVKLSDRHRRWVLLAALVGSGVCFAVWTPDTYVYNSKMAITADNVFNIGFRWLASASASVFALLLLIELHAALPARWVSAFVVAGRDSLYIYILQEYAFLLILKLASGLTPMSSHVVLGDAIAVVIGVSIAYGCWQLGGLLSRNSLSAKMLFGKQLVPNPLRSPVGEGMPQ